MTAPPPETFGSQRAIQAARARLDGYLKLLEAAAILGNAKQIEELREQMHGQVDVMVDETASVFQAVIQHTMRNQSK